jgi:molybdopterin-guanine dinucleotide biosynthesis protein A
MGRDKATLELGGVSLAVRAANVLRDVAYPVRVVGPEAGSGLEPVDDPSEGPLVAFVHGARALPADRPILLLACDMPLVEPDLLRGLVDALGDADAAVPVADDRDQPLCACYAQRAAMVATSLVARGERSMRALLETLDVHRVHDAERALIDIDTPADLAALERPS